MSSEIAWTAVASADRGGRGSAAGEAGWQDHDAVGAEADRVTYRGVVGDATVEENAALELDWREHRRDGCRGQYRWNGVAGG